MDLSTSWSRGLGLRVPIVNAPMGGVAGGALAAAVTAAGGVGMIGMGSAATVRTLKDQLAKRGTVNGPFGIGLVDWVMRRQPGLLETALAAEPTVISVSFGDDFSWVSTVHDAGSRAVTQVYDHEEAQRAQDAGIDILVARGSEGGGHGAPTLSTLPLLDAVLRVASVPVLAAGGIATPRSLASVLTAGASGVWLGTRLSACAESLLDDSARRTLIGAGGADTVLTSVFDEALGYDWPKRFPSRVLRNEFTDLNNTGGLTEWAKAHFAAGVARNDPRFVPVDAGTGVDDVLAVETIAEIIEKLCAGVPDFLGE